METISSSIYQAFGLVVVASVAFLSQVQAVVPPPPGGYPNFTTAAGDHALQALTAGVGNTAIGTFSLFRVATGNFNTAVGAGALDLNQADSNTASGAAALLFNTTGTRNTAVGTAALELNDSGGDNNAVGAFALFNNTDGGGNNAFGEAALYSHQTGGLNDAFGFNALNSDQSGISNNAFGGFALDSNITGSFNTAMGDQALIHSTGNRNTAIGFGAGGGLATGDQNVYIGADTGPGFNTTESNHTYIRNINNTTVSGGGTDNVTVDLTSGLLGHASSSRRYKEEIKLMDNASEALYRLKPVSYHYKKDIDPTQSPAFGLIAEDVAEVNPNLVARNVQGQPESVHYEMVNAMLLNEFLKEHRTVQEQGTIIARQQKQIDALTAGLQKVSAQLATANGAAGMRSDKDGPSRKADVSRSEQVNPSLADSR